MKVGIVGSRKRDDKENVYALVDSLDKDDIVVSGGCRGVDTWAESRAKKRGLQVMIFKPDLTDVKNNYDRINRYYERNKKIVENSDVVYAFVSKDRKGGTENTIKWTKMFNKKVIIV